MASQFVDLPLESSNGITSINGNSNPAQTIAAGTGISVSSSGGTTTITNTGGSGGANFPHNTDIVDMTGVTGIVVASLLNQQLNDSSGISLDWTNRLLYDAGGVPTLDWTNFLLKYGSGITSLDWQNSFLYDQATRLSEDYNARLLYDIANTDSVDWQNRFLQDSSAIVSVSYGARQLADPSAVTSIDWNGRYLIDSGSETSIDYENRLLINSGGSAAADWGNGYLKNPSGNSVDWINSFLIDNSGNNTLDWQNKILYGNGGQPVAEFDNGTGTFQAQGFATATDTPTATNGGSHGVPIQVGAVLIHVSGGTIASFTLTLGFTTPNPGQKFTISSDGTITSLTVNFTGGQTPTVAITTITASTPIDLQYNSSTNTWFRV